MAFSDSIADDLLVTVRVMRESTGQDASGNYATAATTITHTMKGDIQPMSAGHTAAQRNLTGIDYFITHTGFFDVPGTVPAVGDTVTDETTNYQVRNVANWKTHLRLDLEELGV